MTRRLYIREYMRQYRVTNKTKIAEIARRRYERIRTFVRALKEGPCADCGKQFPYYVMDFHHVSGVKKFDIGMNATRSIRTLKAEIKKCVLLCSNCHRIRTHGGKQ